MSYPDNLKYTTEHEWVLVEGDQGTIGITNHAQSELGDIVFVDLPKVGGAITKGVTFGSVESVKAVSDIYAPVSGEVLKSMTFSPLRRRSSIPTPTVPPGSSKSNSPNRRKSANFSLRCRLSKARR